MSASLQPVLENLDEALERLEQVIEHKLDVSVIGQTEMDLGDEMDMNVIVASKLDSTIARLETLLGEE